MVETVANFRVQVPSKDTAAIWLLLSVTTQECSLNVARSSDISREAKNLDFFLNVKSLDF